MRSIIIFALFVSIHSLKSQCTPVAADNCEDTNVLCSLDELNGVTCQTVDYSNPTACLPSNGSGKPDNTSWYAFVTDVGTVILSIPVSYGLNNNELELGS